MRCLPQLASWRFFQTFQYQAFPVAAFFSTNSPNALFIKITHCPPIRVYIIIAFINSGLTIQIHAHVPGSCRRYHYLPRHTILNNRPRHCRHVFDARLPPQIHVFLSEFSVIVLVVLARVRVACWLPASSSTPTIISIRSCATITSCPIVQIRIPQQSLRRAARRHANPIHLAAVLSRTPCAVLRAAPSTITRIYIIRASSASSNATNEIPVRICAPTVSTNTLPRSTTGTRSNAVAARVFAARAFSSPSFTTLACSSNNATARSSKCIAIPFRSRRALLHAPAALVPAASRSIRRANHSERAVERIAVRIPARSSLPMQAGCASINTLPSFVNATILLAVPIQPFSAAAAPRSALCFSSFFRNHVAISRRRANTSIIDFATRVCLAPRSTVATAARRTISTRVVYRALSVRALPVPPGINAFPHSIRYFSAAIIPLAFPRITCRARTQAHVIAAFLQRLRAATAARAHLLTAFYAPSPAFRRRPKSIA